MAVTVAIVEDDKELREDLASFINSRRGLQCIGQFATAEDAVKSLPSLHADVVLMDIHLPGMSGIECIASLKPRLTDTQFVVLTVFEEAEKIFAALRAGASGYLLKRAAPAELAEAIEQVHAGGSPMSPQIARQVVQFFQMNKPAPLAPALDGDGMSERERELVSMLARGKQYKEIADHLNISVDTVRSHIRRIYKKLHVHSRTEAAMKFVGK